MTQFKEFSWERYQAGEEVQYRGGGKPLEIICFEKSKVKYPVGSVFIDDDGRHIQNHHRENGAFINGNVKHSLDLVMKPKKKTVWINLYKDGEDETSCGRTYKSKHDAEKRRLICVRCIGTFPIEIEE